MADEIPIVDVTELGALSPGEGELLAEDTDLLPWERRHLLAVVRAVESDDYLDLLGLAPGASARDLKRAYFELAKQLHPDRYYGRSLGSFAPLLDRVFAAVSQFVKTLTDSRTVVAAQIGPAGPRRRQSERLAFQAPVIVGGTQGGELVELEMVDVSRGGAFLAGRFVAGEPVLELLLKPPQAAPFAVRGQIAWSRASGGARAPGIGVRFEPLDAAQRSALEELLALARGAAPRWAGVPAGEAAPGGEEAAGDRAAAPRFARGTERILPPARVVGIDLGTSYTSVAAAVASRVQVLPWPDGSRAIPSVIAFPRPGEVVVGVQARARRLRDPQHVVSSAKRLLGRRLDDTEIAGHLRQAAFDRTTAPDGSVMIEMWGEPYHTAQLCAYLLGAARANAERVLGHTVERAVVTVPVSFTPERVQLLQRAGQIAHLEILQVIEEPAAAALASRHTPGFGGLIGVYDFGGGTFDFSVVEARGGDFRVLTTAGDSWLGGDDLDQAVAEAAANLFWRVHRLDLRQRAVEWQHLLLSAEKAKRDLSVVDAATLFVPEVMHTSAGAQDLRIKVGRDRAEPLWAPAIERSIDTARHALAVLGIRPSDLDAIYLSGGTSYVPAVRRALSQHFRVPIRTGAPPDHAVCLGAGLQAAYLERRLPPTRRPAG
jgi:actin-like ATPase involved in cell morphogenesis